MSEPEPDPVPALAEAGARPEAAREVGGWHKNGLKRKKKNSLNEKRRKKEKLDLNKKLEKVFQDIPRRKNLKYN